MKLVILFDLYGVLKLDSYESWLAMHNLKRAGRYQELAHQLDTQELSQAEFFTKLAAFSGAHLDEISAYFERNTAVPAETYEMLQELQKRYRLGLISNGSIHTREMLTKTHLAQYFEAIIISAEVGVTKPDTMIYRKALEQLSINASDALFIDDNLINVEAARSCGIESIQFKNFSQILDILVFNANGQ